MAMQGFQTFMGMMTNGFGGNDNSNEVIKGNGGFNFGFGGKNNGGFNFGVGGKSNGGLNFGGKMNGKFDFGFGGKDNGQVNGNSGTGFIASVISALREILSEYFNIAKGLMTGRSWAETVSFYNLDG
jgi:hypothetical protein